MVDAHSKWPEVIGPMKTTTADSNINAMGQIFARYGLPTQVVSNNSPPFQSVEYEEFPRQNGIQRILVSPYHPSSNRLAERFVQTFKYPMESSADDPTSSIQKHTIRYYRIFPLQAILTARTSHSIVSGYTWYWISLGQPARQNEVQSRQVCKIPRDSCRWQCSRTWPPIETEVAGWYCRSVNFTSFLSSPVERWMELEETCSRCTSKHSLVLLWLNPALSKLHLINLLKALLLPVPRAVHPHLKNQSQGSRQAHLLLPSLLRFGPNVLLNHHRDWLKKWTKTIKSRLNDIEQCF